MSGTKFINVSDCNGCTALINTRLIVYAELVEDYYVFHMVNGEKINIDAEPAEVECYLLMR